MTFSDWYWLIWVAVLFGVPEAAAILTHHPEYTLSASVWRLRDCQPVLFVIGWICFIAWLTIHFITGSLKRKK